MSTPGTPGAAGKPPKTMSSRLATMKFMQRAAASTPTNADGDESAKHQNKRRRTGEYTPTSTPGTPSNQPPSTPRSSELNRSVTDIAAEEERARHQASARYGNTAGETQWVLKIPGLTPGDIANVQAQEDFEDSDSDESLPAVGRHTFGSFKRKNKATKASTTDSPATNGKTSDDEDDGSGYSTSGSDSAEEENTYASARAEISNKKDRKMHQQNTMDSIKAWKGTGAISGNSGGRQNASAGNAKRKDHNNKAFAKNKRPR